MVFSTLHYRPIFFIVGIFLLILAATMMIPAFIDFWSEDPSAQSFIGACFMSAFAGGISVLAYCYEGEIEFRVRETFFSRLLPGLRFLFLQLFPLFYRKL